MILSEAIEKEEAEFLAHKKCLDSLDKNMPTDMKESFNKLSENRWNITDSLQNGWKNYKNWKKNSRWDIERKNYNFEGIGLSERSWHESLGA